MIFWWTPIYVAQKNAHAAAGATSTSRQAAEQHPSRARLISLGRARCV